MPRRATLEAACNVCGQPLIFARIGGHSIPLDRQPDPAGTVAVHTTAAGGRLGRWLGPAEHPYGWERRHAQHRCPRPPVPPPQPDLFTTTEGDS